MNEVISFLEQSSALVEKSLYDMYQQAVIFSPYSFL